MSVNSEHITSPGEQQLRCDKTSQAVKNVEIVIILPIGTEKLDNILIDAIHVFENLNLTDVHSQTTKNHVDLVRIILGEMWDQPRTLMQPEEIQIAVNET